MDQGYKYEFDSAMLFFKFQSKMNNKTNHKEQLINTCENCYLSFNTCDRTQNGSTTCSYCIRMDCLCVIRQLGLPHSADFPLQEQEYRQLQQERKLQWDRRVEHLRKQVYLLQQLQYKDQQHLSELESQLVQMHHQFMEMHQQELKERELMETPEQREFREFQEELEVEAMLQQLRLT